MRRALTSTAAAAALAFGMLAGSAAVAAPHGGMGGGGGGHMSMGGGGHMAIGGGGFGGAGIRGGGMGPAFRAGPSVGVMPQRFSGTVGMAPQRFSAPARIRTAQASNGNRGYWDRDRRHFRRGAFFGFAAGYPYWDYGYSDSCWAWNGVEWVYTCYPYPYY